jgi:hypothetical protein
MAKESVDTVHISHLTSTKRLYQTGLAFGLLMSVSLFACSPPPDDETRLREVLDHLVEATAQHDRQTIMQQLAVDFRTTQGMLPQDINRMLFIQFRQNKQIQVFLYDIDVKLMPVTADVELEALLLGSSQWLPERDRRYQVQMRWQKQEDEWRLSRLDWQPTTLTP